MDLTRWLTSAWSPLTAACRRSVSQWRRRSSASASDAWPITLGSGCACGTLTKPSGSSAACVSCTWRATRLRLNSSSCSRPCRWSWAWRDRCEVGRPLCTPPSCQESPDTPLLLRFSSLWLTCVCLLTFNISLLHLLPHFTWCTQVGCWHTEHLIDYDWNNKRFQSESHKNMPTYFTQKFEEKISICYRKSSLLLSYNLLHVTLFSWHLNIFMYINYKYNI